MKFRLLILVALLAGATSGLAQTTNLTFNFASVSGGDISFNGASDTFSFGHDAFGRSFAITSSNLSGLTGLKGSIEGSFLVSNITAGVGYEEATVTNVGTPKFKIYDAFGGALTADLSWASLLRVRTLDGLNPDETINLTNFQYLPGSDAALSLLATSLSGITTVSFQFTPQVTLSQLIGVGPVPPASYSGVATTDVLVPEPSTYAVALGAVALGFAALRRKKTAVA